MAAQFIFTMRDLRRFYPPDREVLRGINLSFYPGAKIGVIGSNGSGKSSLLRIMAGVDDGFTGEARLTPGFTVGYLAQEPELDPPRTSPATSPTAWARPSGLVDRFNEVCAAMGEPDADFDKLLAEQADLQDKIDAAGAWDLDRTFEIAMDALRLPPGRRRRHHALRRRAAPGGPVPAAALQARPAAARRAHQPPRRRVGGLAGAHAAGLPGHRRRRHPRPLLPRQRGRLDPRARPGRRHPLGGQLLLLAGAEAGPPGRRGEGRPVPAAGARSASSSGSACRPGPARAKGKARITAYNELVAEAEAAERRADKLEITIPPGPRLGDRGGRGRRPGQGLRRPAARSTTCRSSCPRAASSASSAPTAPARPRCSG